MTVNIDNEIISRLSKMAHEKLSKDHTIQIMAWTDDSYEYSAFHTTSTPEFPYITRETIMYDNESQSFKHFIEIVRI